VVATCSTPTDSYEIKLYVSENNGNSMVVTGRVNNFQNPFSLVQMNAYASIYTGCTSSTPDDGTEYLAGMATLTLGTLSNILIESSSTVIGASNNFLKVKFSPGTKLPI
jgi:hypothetical protein